MYGTLCHSGCIVRLVFVAVHYPRACNKQVGYCTLAGLRGCFHRKRLHASQTEGAWHRVVTKVNTRIWVCYVYKPLHANNDLNSRGPIYCSFKRRTVQVLIVGLYEHDERCALITHIALFRMH